MKATNNFDHHHCNDDIGAVHISDSPYLQLGDISMASEGILTRFVCVFCSMVNYFRIGLIMKIVIILLSSVAPRRPPCSSCSFDFDPDSPGDGDGDGDGDVDDDHDYDDDDNIYIYI